MSNNKPNAEQRQIVSASRGSRRLCVDALAGTGKTSTLELVAEASPYKQFLYVAYNRAIKDEAAGRFPRNVHCVTSHGMVFQQYGRRMSHRLNSPRVPSYKAARVLGISQVRVEYCVSCGEGVEPGDGSHAGHAVMAEVLDGRRAAALVTRTVDRFCHSADPEVGYSHVPWVQGLDERLVPGLRSALVPFARDAWDDLNSARGELKFTHDVYLKQAQLDGWTARQGTVMLDEAQDTNPCVSSLLLDQRGKSFILVGDPNQAIYEWRGAEDAMASFEADDRLSLTGSYRFGPAVAEEANRWLELLGTRLRLRGWRKRESVVRDQVDGEPDAILCRSNAGCIVATMAQLERGKRVAIVGGGAAIEQLARAAQDLQQGRTTDHPELTVFQSWSDVQRYCKEEPQDAGTLVPLVKAVDSHGPQAILQMCSQLSTEDRADVTVSTAHKAKGRQWDKVQIGTDFQGPGDTGKQPGREELRLAYVAVTRAKFELGRGSLAWIDDATAPEQSWAQVATEDYELNGDPES